jgi:PmbA protein
MQYNEMVDCIKNELTKVGVSDYELFYLESDDLTIELKEKKVDSLTQAIDKSLSLRVLKDGRIGFSYCTKIERDGIKRMVENAFHTSKSTKADECNQLSQKDYDSLPEIKDFDNRLKDITFEEKLEALEKLEDAAYGYDERVKSARKLEFKQSLKDIRVLNSYGIDCLHKKTVFSFSAIVAASEGDESEISWESDFSNYYDKLDPAKVGEVAAKKACAALNGRVIKSEKLPIILDRMVSSELLSVLAPSFYADYVLKNKSSLKDKIGAKILSENLTILDDPLYDGGIATFPFDAEGSLSKTTSVVKNGVLLNYLSDTFTSKKMGIDNSANSVKGSLFSPPNVGNTNFYVVPGKRGKDELVRDMGRGLIITEAMGLHTANPISGDFSIGISGFFVDGGEIAYPVRGLVFSGNLFELLNDVTEVANDLKFYDKSAAPSLLIKNADIAGE